MEKLKKYKKILRSTLEQYASVPFSNAPNLNYHLIINPSETEFVLLKSGWVNKIFRHGIVFHFLITDEKIRLFKNNTDIEIGQLLVEKGVLKTDIVLEFVSEFERELEGYGTR